MQPSTDDEWDPESTPSYWVNRASRLLLRLADARLRPLGLSMGQLPVLEALSDGASLSQKELARRARVEQPTMAEMLARMQRDGVVRRDPDPDDKRGSLISLTKQALSRIPEAREALLRGNREALEGFSEGEVKTLRKLLRRVVRNLEGETDR